MNDFPVVEQGTQLHCTDQESSLACRPESEVLVACQGHADTVDEHGQASVQSPKFWASSSSLLTPRSLKKLIVASTQTVVLTDPIGMHTSASGSASSGD